MEPGICTYAVEKFVVLKLHAECRVGRKQVGRQTSGNRHVCECTEMDATHSEGCPAFWNNGTRRVRYKSGYGALTMLIEDVAKPTNHDAEFGCSGPSAALNLCRTHCVVSDQRVKRFSFAF